MGLGGGRGSRGGGGGRGVTTFERSARPGRNTKRSPLTTYAGAEISPSFSPDGRQVAFAWNGEKRDNLDIYVKMVDGGNPLRLTTDPAPDRIPKWSPDGRHVAFMRQQAIYLVPPLGGAERKLTDGANSDIAWTPDSRAIAFVDASGAVVLLNLQTGARRQLTDPPPTSGGDRSFAFSPDGNALAFVRWTTSIGAGELYVMPLSGGPLKRIELPNNFIYELAWSPDGDAVVAASSSAGQLLYGACRSTRDSRRESPDWRTAPDNQRFRRPHAAGVYAWDL